MASIIPGYEYDIFISYRQKDNKGDRWVSEFVDALKDELESTFKEEISVYFDINPHDGLLETHDVDASLKEKLKCLVFIPIISRTYCDPKSFAWEHEFKAFIEQASQNQFGLKVKLPGGNIATRILPVQIHELEAEDKKLVEKELGGFLRGVEFIYKEPGVNRPLRANEDHPDNNLNKTFYRNQINKVANAAKEIISSLSKLELTEEKESLEFQRGRPGSAKNSRATIILMTVSILLLLIIGFITIPKLFKSPGKLDKTIAVLPFRNLSNDTTKFVDGFMEELLNNLQKVKSFTVRSRTSSEQYRDTKKSISAIGDELNAYYLIQGSVGREGNRRKIWVQLIESKADRQIWSGEYLKEMTIEQIFSLQSEIAKEIATELNTVLSSEEVREIEKRPTENLEAYNYYLQGNYYYWKSYASQDYESAIKLYEKAVELDPNFAMAYARIGISLLAKY
ncbi:MAG TPA: tetratricopeptide repeat protein [Bacteroidales bacterium]|nr:tetratricopeptide repeat protein [Bacteroidales bacterium]